MSGPSHLKKVRRQLNKNLRSAYRGLRLWRKIAKQKEFGKSAVILLPGKDREINYLALLYLDAMLEKRKYKKAIILTHDPAVVKCADMFSRKIVSVVFFSRKKAEHLMQYYCLYEFDKRFIVASLDEPVGRNGTSLVGKRGTTKEEVFVIGVYRVYPFQRPDAPWYEGDDVEIKNFLEGYPK